MFFDEAKIYVKGRRGQRCGGISPRGARAAGGQAVATAAKARDVYLMADPQVNTLIRFSKQVHFRGPRMASPAKARIRPVPRASDLVIRRASGHGGLR